MTEPNPLFSTYRQGENRITSTILAVFAHINSGIVEDVLETLLADELSLLAFENQVRGEQGVPDGVVRGPSAIYFETKRTTNAVDTDQLERHLEQLTEEPADSRRLLVLTPDAERPDALDQVDDGRIEWVNFDGLSSAIETVLDRETGSAGDATAIPTEREAFLLRELNRFLYDEELISGKEDRVLVVPARRAWPEYEETGLYFCQPYRSFRPSDHMAFYAEGAIQRKIPQIYDAIESVELSENGVETVDNSDLQDRLKDAIEKLPVVNAEPERLGREQKVIFLGKSDDERTLTLSNPVENDKTAKDSDRGVAFVQNQRYVSLSDLRENPTRTTELE
jgi:hypothetical protein